MPARPTVVSLFSGAGGLDLGLEMAGFETRVCVEWEAYACASLRANREARPIVNDSEDTFLAEAEILERDVRSVSGADLLKAARLKKGEATLLAGGPPCVTFSVAGRREGLTAETGQLFQEYVRLLRAARPKALIYENVKGLMSAVGSDGAPGGAFIEVWNAIEAEGYALVPAVINAADYGVPQMRERVILLGLRGDVAPEFPEPTHAEFPVGDREAWRTVADAIGDLPPAAAPRTQPVVPNHVARLHSPAVIADLALTPPGARNQKVKRDRLRWDRPSKVIRAQGKPKADGSGQKNSSHQSIHPVDHRQITPRECARIQTFPDWYALPDTFVNAYRLMGDAVPPRLAFVLGLHMRDELNARRKESQGTPVAA